MVLKCLVTQSCPTLCDHMNYRPPGSSVHGLLQARIVEWVAIPFFSGSFWSRDWTCVSCISCIAGWFFTIWATRKALLGMEFCSIVPICGLTFIQNFCVWFLHILLFCTWIWTFLKNKNSPFGEKTTNMLQWPRCRG